MTWEGFLVGLVVCMVPFATAIPIMYAYVADWSKSPEGRAVMTCYVGLALLVDLAVLYEALPWFPGKNIAAALVYGLILFGLVRFTVVLARTLLEQRRKARRQ